jgi:hypothetical protein
MGKLHRLVINLQANKINSLDGLEKTLDTLTTLKKIKIDLRCIIAFYIEIKQKYEIIISIEKFFNSVLTSL